MERPRWNPVLAALIAATFSLTAQGQSGDNAAYWYQRAIDAYSKLPRSTVDLIHNYDWSNPDLVVTDELRFALGSAQSVIRLAQRGAGGEYSDFGLNYEEGFELLLPHLNSMRGIVKLMRTDTVVKLRDGDTSNAATQIASLYRIGAHMSEDRILISGLVGQAIFSVGEFATQRGLDEGAFGAEDSAAILQSLKGLDPIDPFAYVEGMSMEREIMATWLSTRFEEDGGLDVVVDSLFLEPEGELRTGLENLDDDTFYEQLDQVDQLANTMIETFMMSDEQGARDKLAALGEEIASGEHGMLAQVLMPAYGKIYDRMLQAREQVATRIESLEAIAQGEVEPQAIANGAVWYIRAAAMLHEIDAEQRASFTGLAQQLGEPVDEQMAETLRNAQAVVETVRMASSKGRCDFAPYRYNTVRVLPDYLAGQRGLGAFLLADAVRLVDETDFAGAAERVALCFHLAADLGTDEIIVTSLVSHDLFNRAFVFTNQAYNDWYFDRDEQPVLNEAVEQTGRSDPFGHIAAIMAAKQEVNDDLRFWVIKSPTTVEQLEKITSAWGGDQLLYALIATSPGSLAYPPEPEKIAEVFQPFADLLSIEAAVAAAARHDAVEALVSAGELKIFEDNDPAEIANVRGSLLSARADLRRAVLMLGKHKPEPAAEEQDEPTTATPTSDGDQRL